MSPARTISSSRPSEPTSRNTMDSKSINMRISCHGQKLHHHVPCQNTHRNTMSKHNGIPNLDFFVLLLAASAPLSVRDTPMDPTTTFGQLQRVRLNSAMEGKTQRSRYNFQRARERGKMYTYKHSKLRQRTLLHRHYRRNGNAREFAGAANRR